MQLEALTVGTAARRTPARCSPPGPARLAGGATSAAPSLTHIREPRLWGAEALLLVAATVYLGTAAAILIWLPDLSLFALGPAVLGVGHAVLLADCRRGY
jgi:hypothetical protein